MTVWILRRSVVYVHIYTKTKMKLCSSIAYTRSTNLHIVDAKTPEIVVVFPT